VLVNPTAERVRYLIRIFGTGQDGITADLQFVGTYHLLGGDFVGHVFWAGIAE
jgi:hypothetical protein